MDSLDLALNSRRMLLPRLVRPEEGHKPPVPMQRSAVAGFSDAPQPASVRSGESLYPCTLTDETDQSLAGLARDLVKVWQKMNAPRSHKASTFALAKTLCASS